jgi:sugar-specific transcriptional regulator TrmB
MNTQLIQILEESGLEDKQARVYLAALELGGATVTQISRKSRVERVNTYYVLDQLIERGLISLSQRKNGSLYMASNPKSFVKKAELNLEQLNAAMPQFLAIENSNTHRPVVSFYEGKGGMVEVLEDMIHTMENVPLEKREILEYLSVESAAESIYEPQVDFMNRRIQKKIRLRWILPNTPGAQEFAKKTKESYREVRLVPADRFPLLTEMNIYGNKINMLAEKGAEGGIIIEHPELAQTQREIFELAWLGAETFN